ncbi:hypothetical protein [Paenibacillus alvei]|uniref:hypothetical protein n=1 Tax=Paenibacillus alvei TaxID=44250 RepID=UPI001F27587C|nr:hypothetical protein [Paenibacillus alvei]
MWDIISIRNLTTGGEKIGYIDITLSRERPLTKEGILSLSPRLLEERKHENFASMLIFGKDQIVT